MKTRLFISLFLLFSFSITHAQLSVDDEKSLWDKILDKFYHNNKPLKNFPTVDFSIGYSQADFSDMTISTEITPIYSMELKYGFTRFYPVGDLDNVFYYASETVSIGDYTSHLKPRSIVNKGITTDNWRFGFGYKNGYGFQFDDKKMIFYHGSNLNWSNIDVELDKELITSNVLTQVDETTRFGNSFEIGMKMQLSKTVNIDLCHESTLVFPDFPFGKWALCSFSELAVQRTIDFFGDKILTANQKYYPIVNALAKYGVSYLFNRFKRSDIFSNGNDKWFAYTSFKIGFTFIFE